MGILGSGRLWDNEGETARNPLRTPPWHAIGGTACSQQRVQTRLITSSRRLWDDQGEPAGDLLCISVLDSLQKDVDSLLGPFESESVNSNPVEEGYSDSTEAKE